MKSSGTVSALLHHKGSAIWSVSPETTVFETIKLMADKNIGAVLVMSGAKLTGVFTDAITRARSATENPPVPGCGKSYPPKPFLWVASFGRGDA